MRTTLFLAAAALTLPAAAPLAAQPKPTPQAELKRLAGAWVVFDMEVEGGGPGRVDGKRVVVEGSRFTLYHDTTKLIDATVKLNPAAEPRAIDLTQAGRAMAGIYRFEGGRLEVCLAAVGKPRPTAFTAAAEPGGGSVLYVLKPKTPSAKPDPAEAKYQAEMKRLAGKWVATARELGGQPDANPADHGLLVEGGRVTTLFRGDRRDAMTAVRVDPAADPPQVDFRTETGKVWHGIYRLAEGKLELCLPGIEANKRPTAFTTKDEPGAGVVYTVFEQPPAKK